MKLPLEGLLVLEFCQYLAGPYAGLRLADLGATVVKIERPGTGDACRSLVTMNQRFGNDSLLFHTINRNKESISANMKDPGDLEWIRSMIKKADVVTHNFRPGVMEKNGLDYQSVKLINEKVIYGHVTGYGSEGPWRDKPGQDLLAQSLSGLTYLSGNASDNPTPFGIAVADMMCGTHLVQGILSALIRRNKTGQGGLIEVSLLESMIDLQFEVITTVLNSESSDLKRSEISNAHTLLPAPYGIYSTFDGYIALSIMGLDQLLDALGTPNLLPDQIIRDPFGFRDEAKRKIQAVIVSQPTKHWLSVFHGKGIWCSDVYDYEKLLTSEVYKTLEMELEVMSETGAVMRTTRCPIRIDGQRLCSDKAGPELGSANAKYGKDFV